MNENEIETVLRIDCSVRRGESESRAIGDVVVNRLAARHPGLQLVAVDLADGLPHIDADWVDANLTPAEQRSAEQRARLAASDRAVATLMDADAIVLTAPVYTLSVPSPLKAWIDHVCRAGLTFRYTSDGPQGLLHDRPVYLVMASGGVPFGSPVDFASAYLRQVLHFIGIDDVRLIGAERVVADAAGARAAAFAQLDQWLPDRTGQAA